MNPNEVLRIVDAIHRDKKSTQVLSSMESKLRCYRPLRNIMAKMAIS